MKKGQAVLEFLLVVLIVIIYLGTTIMPLTKDMQKAVMDTDSVSRTNNEVQKIYSVIEEISTLGVGSKKAISVFIPADSNIRIYSNRIAYYVQLRLPPYASTCNNDGLCKKEIYLNPISIQLPPKSVPVGEFIEVVGPTRAMMIFEKVSGDNVSYSQGG